MCTIVAQLPLIYEVPVENLVKYSLAIFYLIMQLTTFKVLFALPFKELMPKRNRLFLALFVLLELYKQLAHKVRSKYCHNQTSFPGCFSRQGRLFTTYDYIGFMLSGRPFGFSTIAV